MEKCIGFPSDKENVYSALCANSCCRLFILALLFLPSWVSCDVGSRQRNYRAIKYTFNGGDTKVILVGLILKSMDGAWLACSMSQHLRHKESATLLGIEKPLDVNAEAKKGQCTKIDKNKIQKLFCYQAFFPVIHILFSAEMKPRGYYLELFGRLTWVTLGRL